MHGDSERVMTGPYSGFYKAKLEQLPYINLDIALDPDFPSTSIGSAASLASKPSRFVAHVWKSTPAPTEFLT